MKDYNPLFKGLVTVNTDASFYEETNSGGWATWIRFQGQLVTGAGKLLQPDTSERAEMMAICNALIIIARKEEWNVQKIILNTDCMGAINKFRNKVENDIINTAYKEAPFMHAIEYRHVPGHRYTNTKKHWVNDWCDKKAKHHARELNQQRLNQQ